MGAQVTEDEVDKRMRELQDRRKRGESVDASTVRGIPPDKHAHWVNRHSRNGARIQHYENHGYELAKGSKDKEGKGIKALGGRVIEGDKIVNGDNILMVTDRDNYIDRLAQKKLRGKQAEEAFIAKKADDMRRIARDEHGVTVEITNTSKQGAERVVRRGTRPDDDDD